MRHLRERGSSQSNHHIERRRRRRSLSNAVPLQVVSLFLYDVILPPSAWSPSGPFRSPGLTFCAPLGPCLVLIVITTSMVTVRITLFRLLSENIGHTQWLLLLLFQYIEGSRPEWCVSSMVYSRNTPFWSGTLDMQVPCLNVQKKCTPSLSQL